MRYRVVFFIALLIISPLQAATVTLKIATLSPDGTNWMKAFRAAGKQILDGTEGRVKLRYYPGGVMGNDKSVLRKIKIGQLHGAAIGSGGLANIHPDTQIYAIPFAFTSYAEVDQARAQLDDMILEKLDQAGYLSYGLTEGGFAYMMSDKKITSLDEAKDRKIWVPEGDRVSRKALEALDISPVPLPISDVLTGLQTGLINAIAAPPTGAIALQWHTRISHLTDAPLLYTYGTVVFNKKALKAVSDDDKKVLKKIFEKTLSNLNKSSREDNEKAMKAMQKQGIAIHNVETAALQSWRQKTAAAVDEMTGDRALTKEALQQLRSLLGNIRKGG